MSKKTLGVLIVLAMMILASCLPIGPANGTDKDKPEMVELVYLTSGISSFVDNDHGNVCYVYSGYYKGGISCLPLATDR